MPEPRGRWRRLIHFSTLYFAEGAILSYFLTFNILYLRDKGFAADEIGFFQATLVLPFLLKIVLGMLSDRFSLLGLGHRYPYMLLGLLLQVAAVLLMPMIDLPGQLGVFFGAAMAAAIGMALYDTCTDGLAVETTPEGERGLVQGAMVAARAAGILAALLIGGFLIGDGDWPDVFVMLALMTLPAMVTTVGFWRVAGASDQQAFSWSAFRTLMSGNARLLALVACLYALALDGVLAYLSYHADADTVGAVGLISGLIALSMVGRMIGAAISGWLAERLGFRRGMQWAVSLSALACLALSFEGGTVFLAVTCLLFGMAYGFFTTIYAASAMLLSDPRVAASMFAVFMLFLNVGVALGQAVGGLITQSLGFRPLALIMATLVMASILLVRRLQAH